MAINGDRAPWPVMVDTLGRGVDVWDRHGSEVLGSARTDRRAADPASVSPVTGRGAALAAEGEHIIWGYGSGVTLVEGRRGGQRAYRLVGPVIDGEATVWDLPTAELDEAKELATAFDRASATDSLTGALRWRPGLLRHGSALVAVDIIGLKVINCHHGMQVGDWVLEGVGRALVKDMAPWRVFRVDGDEFVVEIPESLDHASAESLANQIRSLTSRPLPGVPVRVACRVGVTLLRIDDDEHPATRSVEDALEQAALEDVPFRIFGPDDHLIRPEPSRHLADLLAPIGEFTVGDRVFVLRWLRQGTREGPFPIVEVSGPGRYVVGYGSLASYLADAAEHELIRATPAVIEALPRLLHEQEAQHWQVDAAFADELRRLSADTAQEAP